MRGFFVFLFFHSITILAESISCESPLNVETEIAFDNFFDQSDAANELRKKIIAMFHESAVLQNIDLEEGYYLDAYEGLHSFFPFGTHSSPFEHRQPFAPWVKVGDLEENLRFRLGKNHPKLLTHQSTEFGPNASKPLFFPLLIKVFKEFSVGIAYKNYGLILGDLDLIQNPSNEFFLYIFSNLNGKFLYLNPIRSEVFNSFYIPMNRISLPFPRIYYTKNYIFLNENYPTRFGNKVYQISLISRNFDKTYEAPVHSRFGDIVEVSFGLDVNSEIKESHNQGYILWFHQNSEQGQGALSVTRLSDGVNLELDTKIEFDKGERLLEFNVTKDSKNSTQIEIVFANSKKQRFSVFLPAIFRKYDNERRSQFPWWKRIF